MAPYSLNNASDASSEFPGITLWLDATDSGTIVTGTGNEVNTWENKIDKSVKMTSHSTNKPDTDESINGLNALGFDKRSDNNMEYMDAKKNGSNWTPATSNGAISGKVQNLVLIMAARMDTRRKSYFPFGFGWGDHFPWNNGHVYWKHESSRPTFSIGANGTTFVLSMVHSKSLGKQLAYMNGNKVFDGPRTNDNQLGNMGVFRWPSTTSGSGFGIDWTLGEMMVVSGTMTDSAREKAEGYLAHKWGIALTGGHTWASGSPYEDFRNGAELTLYWGTSDGGETENWDQSISLVKTTSQLEVWLDAADHSTIFEDANFNTSATTSVGGWKDKSGKNRHITQSNQAYKPSLNAKSIGLNGSQYLFNTSPFMHDRGSIEVFVVASGNTQSDKRIISEGSSSNNNPVYAFQTTNQDPHNRLAVFFRNSANSVMQSQSALSSDVAMDGSFKILNWKDTGSQIMARVNGGNPGSASYTRSGTMGTDRFCVGGVLRSSFASGFTGNIKEIIILSPTTDSERQKLEGYLAHKWGLTTSLPITHPFKRLASVTSPADLASYPIDISGLTVGNTYYYRVTATNSEGTNWADQTASFVFQKQINLDSGTLAINTNGTTPSWSATDGSGGNGELETITWTDAQSNTIQYKVAKFSFDSVNIGDGVSISVAGDNPLHIDVVGDATINSVIDLNASTYAGLSVLGGGYGGTAANHGTGPIHILGTSPYNSGGSRQKGGNLSGSGLVAGEAPGGGSYGGSGGRPELNGGTDSAGTHPISGQTYGTLNLEALLAGSGGGGGSVQPGGSGAGAIKITAGGKLTIGKSIFANAGNGIADSTNDAAKSGAGGSGGSIYLKANELEISTNALISANGGTGAPSTTTGGNNYATDGGGTGSAAGGGGRIYLEGTSSFVNHGSATNANITANGGTTQASSGTPRSGQDGTVRIVRPQVSSLNFTSGTLTINTSTAEISHTDGSFLLGELSNKTFTATDGASYPYKIATFTADTINLGSGVVVNVTGENALSLHTRNHGNLTIGTTINVSGGGATEGPYAGGSGIAGGFHGGLPDTNGYGPGRGKAKSVISGTNEQGGGAAYGGRGNDADSSYSQAYSSADLTNHLLGGSGGGGGDVYAGGAGGGAIELVAHGDGVLTLSGSIKANGGDTSRQHDESGGAGSGGAIRLEGGSVSISGTLEAKGGNGLSATPGGGGRIAIKTNGNLTLGTIALDGYRPGTLHISGATSTNSINYSSGTLTFDTTHGYWHHSSGAHGTGLIEQKDDNGITYKTCTFTFDSINMASGLTVVLVGKNALILKTRNHGNISVGTTLSADGGSSHTTYSSYLYQMGFGIGKLGGHDGGLAINSTSGISGFGPGKGKYKGGGVSGNQVGGGGGYGVPGQYHANDTSFGNTYGTDNLTHLLGGSGGGAGGLSGGGAGGGAISIEADGNGTVTISSGGGISANGGGVAKSTYNGGGGGSGGSIRIAGKSIHNSGSIQAKGGIPPTTSSTYSGGIGGGGRVAFNYSDGFTLGSVDVGSGVYAGSVGQNTPPTVTSADTAAVKYSDTLYQKHSATRYEDLLLWYPFDETDGSTAVDFSKHGRNGSLKNMTSANRVSGKMGRALSFDTISSKTSADTSGQYLDLGSWIFGGAHSIAMWVKADEWRNSVSLFDLSGSDRVELRMQSISSENLFHSLSGTAGGDESISTAVLDWETWVHVIITIEDGGTNASTGKVYVNGSLTSTTGSLTVPDSVLRTEQYIGRSHTTTKPYFAGDLDDFRLYGIALSADEALAVYNEKDASAWYQITALNNPTQFSATGLPNGLAVNPDTGDVYGHTTLLGNHTANVSASNLSGSDSKSVTFTVSANTPLLAEVQATAIGSTSATARFNLLSTGGADTSSITVYHGSSDQGNTTSGWSGNSSLSGAQSTGFLELGMSGLSASTTYVFRIKATNSAGDAWSAPISFTTGAQAQAPSISALDASSVAGTTATANGNLLSFDGSDQPTVTIYYDTEAGLASNTNDTVLTSSTTSAQIIHGSPHNNHPPVDAFDGDTTSKFLTDDGVNNGLILTLGTSVIRKLAVTSADASSRDPATYEVHGSNNGVNYTLISSGTMPSFTARHQDKFVEFNNSDFYSTYRVVFPTVSSGTTLAFAELKLSGPSPSLSSSASLGTKAVGTFTHNLTSLTAGTAYKYLFKATNNGGTSYSGVKSFTTLGPPAVETTAASEITKTSAKLNANLTFANGSDTSVTFYWNTSDGGTTASSWTSGSGGSHQLAGTHGVGTLSYTLSGLTTGTTYYYNVKAVNPQGTVWGTTKTFVPANTALNQYSIPDLALWLDASDIDGNSQADSVTSAVSVSSWTDKSASGIGVSQSNPDLQPSQLDNQFGSKPAVRFDGAGDVLNLGSIRTSSGGYSAYALVKRESESGDDNAHLISESTWSLIPNTSKDAFSAKVVKSSSASGKTLTNIKLGKSASTTNNDFGGDLAELLIFSRQLTNSEEQKLEGYLAHRWGATSSLDSNHPYKSVAPIFDNKPLIQTTSPSPLPLSSLKLWLDASDSATITHTSNAVSQWSDKSGNNNHAKQPSTASARPTYSSASQKIVFDGGDILQVTNDPFNGMQEPAVFAVAKWNGLVEWGNTIAGFRGEGNGWKLRQHRSAEMFAFTIRNTGGTNDPTTSSSPSLTNETFLVSAYRTNDIRYLNFNGGELLNMADSGSIGYGSYSNLSSIGGYYESNNFQSSNGYLNGEIHELIVIDGATGTDTLKIEGYLAHKWGLQGSLPNDHIRKNQAFDIFITTGQSVSIQVPATRNPTSWSASGLPTGLSINNSGVIFGSSTTLGDFNATVTASNADGNDTKLLRFTVTKGKRIIDWNQTFAGLVYGDSPVSLTATATGTGDLNYTSSDSDIIEINGTSAIIRGGGSVTLTATAVENTTAFAAIPVTKIISVAKAPLTITGQDLTLPVGTSIPDLNYTATGWKHNDASLGVAANPAAFSNLALWLDASDSSTLFANTTLSTPATSSVAGWKDKSGNNNHAVQSTSANQAIDYIQWYSI